MSEDTHLQQVRLGATHQATGKTRHFRGAVQLPIPSELRIVKYRDDPGYYLLYCDDEGVELTDTYHVTIEGALSQAEWEFQVKPTEWTVVTKS
jgi:hypothetical protein